MKKILVPTDFSDCANNAVDVAKAIALRSGAELNFIHIEEQTPEVVHVSQTKVPAKDAHLGIARYELQHTVDLTEKEGIKAKPIFVLSGTGEELKDYVKPYEIDLIVMGSHGEKGWREVIVGSRTKALLREVSVPVLVVKKPNPNFNPKRIVFASTFKEDVTPCLKAIISFSKYWNAELELVFINMMDHPHQEEEAKEIMKKQMDLVEPVTYTLNVSDTNDEEWGISKFADLVKADMISVVMDKHTGLVGLFKSSVAEKLITHSSLPVLVLNKKYQME